MCDHNNTDLIVKLRGTELLFSVCTKVFLLSFLCLHFEIFWSVVTYFYIRIIRMCSVVKMDWPSRELKKKKNAVKKSKNQFALSLFYSTIKHSATK